MSLKRLVFRVFTFQFILSFVAFSLITFWFDWAMGEFSWKMLLLRSGLSSLGMTLFYEIYHYRNLKQLRPLRYMENGLLIIWEEQILANNQSLEVLKNKIQSNWRFKKYKVVEESEQKIVFQKRLGFQVHTMQIVANNPNDVILSIAVKPLWSFDQETMGTQIAIAIKKIVKS